MNAPKHPPAVAAPAASSRVSTSTKVYRAPVLTRLGRVVDLTCGSGGTKFDNNCSKSANVTQNPFC
jgi:hypothetical protein